MRRYLTVLCCTAIVMFYSDHANSADNQKRTSIADELVGCWRLISVETVRPSGEVIYPFYGKHPQDY